MYQSREASVCVCSVCTQSAKEEKWHFEVLDHSCGSGQFPLVPLTILGFKNKKVKLFLSFEIISDLQKRWKKYSSKNSCLLFMQTAQMLTFTVCVTIYSLSILLLFSESLESSLHTEWPFTPKYLSVYFLETRTFSIIHSAIKIMKFKLLQYC